MTWFVPENASVKAEILYSEKCTSLLQNCCCCSNNRHLLYLRASVRMSIHARNPLTLSTYLSSNFRKLNYPTAVTDKNLNDGHVVS